MSRLDGKVAVVTGSSRGIGAAIARLFAQEGASVAVHGRDAVALSAVRQDIESRGGRAMSVVSDVMAFDQIDALRARVEERFGPVDILVANAGGSPSPPGPIESLSEADWRAAVDGNLTATFLTHAALFLVSSDSDWITGAILDVSGGAVMAR